jgi:hypothetical protein
MTLKLQAMQLLLPAQPQVSDVYRSLQRTLQLGQHLLLQQHCQTTCCCLRVSCHVHYRCLPAQHSTAVSNQHSRRARLL